MLINRPRLALLSFPLLLAVAALGSPGCGTAVTSTGTESTGTGTSTGTGSSTGGAGGAPVTCPGDVPQDGDACQVSGECHYPVQCCGDTIATCPSGHWQVVGAPCIGKTPAPQCPTDLPTPGTPCVQGCLTMSCPYGTCPGSSGPALMAECLGGTWSLQAMCGSGGGIPVGQPCGGAADGGACAAGLSCCYPCGIAGCTDVCAVTCSPSDPSCMNGCLLQQ